MNRWRVGEDRGSKEMDGCPLTFTYPLTNLIPVYSVNDTAIEAGMITEITDLILHHDNHLECT
jgi:hypothetical protein